MCNSYKCLSCNHYIGCKWSIIKVMPNSIEDHPERRKVDKLLMSGKSVRFVAANVSPRVSPSVVQRYRDKATKRMMDKRSQAIVSKAVSSVVQSSPSVSMEVAQQAVNGVIAARETAASPILQRLKQRQARRERWLDLVEREDDVRGFVALDMAEGKDIDLEARLTGALDAPQTTHTTNIMVVMPHDRAEQLQDDDVIDIAEV